MIQIYTHMTEQIKNSVQLYNDSFFNVNIYGSSFSEEEKKYIELIDCAEVVDDEKIISRFGIGSVMDLSTGCKTFLNLLRYPDIIFSVDECGPNVLELLFQLKQDLRIFMSYNQYIRMQEPVQVCFDEKKEVRTVSEYQTYWEMEYKRREEEE